MKYFISEQGSTGLEFDNLAVAYEENGEECFEIKVE